MDEADPDQSLVRRAMRGDESAFTALVRAHEHKVFMLVRGVVRSPEDAADVTQEAFIAVLRHLDTFREDAKFSTWLYRIAIRKAYDHVRKRATELADDPTMIEQVASLTDVFEQQLAQRALTKAIYALDQGFREAILLVDVLGGSIEEAAIVLNIAPGTVKSRVFRGRAELAQSLGTLGYERASKQ
jgi:RNA polymerase sigma-70 factor (ECF subfamily)